MIELDETTPGNPPMECGVGESVDGGAPVNRVRVGCPFGEYPAVNQYG